MVRKVLILLLTALLFVSCSQEVEQHTAIKNLLFDSPISVYSWNEEYKDPLLAAKLKNTGFTVNELYQGLSIFDLLFSGSTSKSVKALEQSNIKTSYLIGDPHWSKASTVIRWALKPLVHYNNTSEYKITNVVLDIENYKDPEVYISMVKEVTAWCHGNGLTVTACVPYWFLEANPQLYEAVDKLSVCVFLVGQEVQLIEPIYKKAQEKHIPLEVVLDTQAPSHKYKVKEENTYHDRSSLELAETINKLKTTCPEIKISLHHLTSVTQIE